jgi:hypothetical protein
MRVCPFEATDVRAIAGPCAGHKEAHRFIGVLRLGTEVRQQRSR